MKEHQFEEIVASLSTIVAIICFYFEFQVVAWIFIVKSIFDWGCVIKEALKDIKKNN